MIRTLNRYIFNEIWPTFLVSLLVLVFVILATRMLSVTEWVISQGLNVSDIAKLIVYLLPGVVFFALPAAVLMSVLIAFLRLSSDNEVIALQSSGISLYQLLPPVVTLSFVVCVVGFFLAVFAGPWGNRSFKDSVFRLAQEKADLSVKERIFSEPFDNVTFYVNSLSSDHVMKDIFIVDSRDPMMTNTVVAARGRIHSYPEMRSIVISLEDGTIFMVDKDLKAARNMRFETYDLNIGLADIIADLKSRKRNPKEMSPGDLFDALAGEDKGSVRYNEMLIELFEKVSIPLAVFLMGLIGAPLGAQLKTRGRIVGAAIGFVVFLIYYMFLAGTRSISETGTVPPLIGVWLPDLFLLAGSVFLLRKAT